MSPTLVRLTLVATTDDRTESTDAKLEQLQQLREEAAHQGSERAIEKHRSQGKLLAHERLEKLLDPGSFVELDRYARHRNPYFGMMERRPYGDAVVTGHGTIFGRKVFVFSQDFTIFGGSLSEAFAEKICKVMDLALKFGCPVIGINDSGGARIQEGVVSLAGYAEIFWRNVQCSGVIPQLSLVMGPCAGGAVYSPAITDFVFMVEGSSYMFITGPDVVKTVTGEEVTFEELGGATTHASKSGVAHFIAADEEACLEDARYLLSFLPQNNLDSPPYSAPSDPRDREDAELDSVIPDNPQKPYEMRDVIRRVVDDGEFLEVHERFAWPTAEVAVMGPEGAVNIVFRKELEEADDPDERRDELIAEYRARFANPYVAAERGYVDDVIEPRRTRPVLINALQASLTKREPRPRRKHGNIPL